MRSMLRWGSALLVCLGAACCYKGFQFPDKAGTIFIHQPIDKMESFKAAFEGQKDHLKAAGFFAYSLHRDLKDPKVLIMTMKCASLRKGLSLVESPEYMSALEKGGAGIPVVWSGVDVRERKYENQPPSPGGIVIARNTVRSFDFWMTCFAAETHHHSGRGYISGNLSVHRQFGGQDAVIVVHEASDVSKAPAFMDGEEMKGTMEATGVVGVEIWYGIDLEEGTF